MPSAWRLIKTKYLETAWDGEGAKQSGGRWNSVGVPVVYTSGTLSLALVEILVHLPSGVLPAYSAVPVEFEKSLVRAVDLKDLPSDWRESPAPSGTRAMGDRWIADGKSAVLRVPSVVVPNESNYILNPNHPDFPQIRIGAPISFPFDSRLLKA
ncbi:MAG: RES family NAD+ phosphorylase [Acidobacteria bacterium]|nr:RES family NAD+ phosphorylase [Acidobacteriota bacterium]